MKTIIKCFTLMAVIAGAVAGVLYLLQEHSSTYVPVYDTEDTLF